jgi:hypothetical protein
MRSISWRWPLVAFIVVACTTPAEHQARLFAQADAAVVAGDLSLAREKLQAARDYDPRDVNATRRLAERVASAGSPTAALAILEDLPAEVPRGTRFLNLYLRLLLRAGRVREGVPLALQLLARHEAQADARPNLLEALTANRTPPGAAPGLPDAMRAAMVGQLAEDGAFELADVWLTTIVPTSPERELAVDRLLAAALRASSYGYAPSIMALAAPADTPAKVLILRQTSLAMNDTARLAALEERFVRLYPDHPAWPEVAAAAAHSGVTPHAHGRVPDARHATELALDVPKSP